MAVEKNESGTGADLLDGFGSAIAEFSNSLSSAMISYFEEDNRPELEYVRLQMETVQTSFLSAIREISTGYGDAEPETRALINRHIENTGATKLLRGTSEIFKRKGISGFIDKIIPIVELIKKILTQIIELFPNFLEKILKRILLPLLEIIDNILQMLSDLFSGGSGSKLLNQAEARFLESHPKWRRMYFETQAPGTDFA